MQELQPRNANSQVKHSPSVVKNGLLQSQANWFALFCVQPRYSSQIQRPLIELGETCILESQKVQ